MDTSSKREFLEFQYHLIAMLRITGSPDPDVAPVSSDLREAAETFIDNAPLTTAQHRVMMDLLDQLEE